MLIQGGGGVKHVYRGITSGAGNVTLPAAVNMDKTVVLSTSKGSEGTVSVSGSYISLPNYDLFNNDGDALRNGSAYGLTTLSTYSKVSARPTSPTCYINSSKTNLTVKEYSARLVDENTIYCDGPVEWQVIEYN